MVLEGKATMETEVNMVMAAGEEEMVMVAGEGRGMTEMGAIEAKVETGAKGAMECSHSREENKVRKTWRN